MNKIYTIILLSLCVLTGCNDDLWNDSLTPEQKALIGKAVQFEPYIELFRTTRVAQSYNHLGGFNANDMMYMYRQYQENGQWVYKTPPGTIYRYTELTNGETGIFEKTSWKVYEGKMFNFTDGSYTNPENQTHTYSKILTKADSITWESGVTVRFRAWVLSHLGNDLSDKTPAGGYEKTVNYPDYMVCDWVTVSGPTNSIPMAMRHLGCRLGFSPRENNQFAKIEITYDPADYRRDDNADTNDNDEADKIITDANGNPITAEQAAANVKTAYESMCWPAGVNMDDLSLMTCASGVDQGNIKHGTLTPEQIATQTRRPEFKSSVDSRLYMVTIPYDMSDGPNKDMPIVLPSYTRFRVWLHDVNNGDGQHESTSNPNSSAPGASESHYHIFSLADVKKEGSTEQAFPNGITLRSGYSYLFTVGYNYKTLEVYAEDNFSWAEQDLAMTEATDRSETKPTAQKYDWWKSAISTACTGTKTGTQYEPKFEIKNETELQELINLVNGNFNTSGIYNDETLNKVVTVKYDPVDKRKEVSRTVRWYAGIGVNGDGSPDTLWVEKSLLEEAGYIFYDKYTPSIADRSAIIEEDYLKGPYTFYDEQVRRRLSVTLTADIDLKDWKLEPIGKDENHPFSGYFDGGGHLLKNVYMGFEPGVPHFGNGTTLFGYVKDGTVANLCLESTHPLSITNKLENGRIVGCSVIAPSTQATLANVTSGFCSFVGCFHQGSSTAPLVNNADMFEMYGCMQAASGISGAALANVASAYDPKSENNFIFSLREDMALDSVGWTSVSCNYYDTELSKGAKAYSFNNSKFLPATGNDGKEIPFHRIQYIRGVPTHIMCAKNDYLADNKTEWMKLSLDRRIEIYGAAPWKAMNFGIFMYNSTVADDINRCKMHYENDSNTGYSHRYPQLKKEEPRATQYINVLQQFN